VRLGRQDGESLREQLLKQQKEKEQKAKEKEKSPPMGDISVGEMYPSFYNIKKNFGLIKIMKKD